MALTTGTSVALNSASTSPGSTRQAEAKGGGELPAPELPVLPLAVAALAVAIRWFIEGRSFRCPRSHRLMYLRHTLTPCCEATRTQPSASASPTASLESAPPAASPQKSPSRAESRGTAPPTGPANARISPAALALISANSSLSSSFFPAPPSPPAPRPPLRRSPSTTAASEASKACPSPLAPSATLSASAWKLSNSSNRNAEATLPTARTAPSPAETTCRRHLPAAARHRTSRSSSSRPPCPAGPSRSGAASPQTRPRQVPLAVCARAKERWAAAPRARPASALQALNSASPEEVASRTSDSTASRAASTAGTNSERAGPAKPRHRSARYLGMSSFLAVATHSAAARRFSLSRVLRRSQSRCFSGHWASRNLSTSSSARRSHCKYEYSSQMSSRLEP
mmetsp:Transcript_25810/g.57869  ORF Transcript_25810/g.57869 Transcript_25810/m.57869 type:complete len:398 (+) Transcript_25810:448-1641(+)